MIRILRVDVPSSDHYPHASLAEVWRKAEALTGKIPMQQWYNHGI
jgi:hypothetical protein